MPNYKAVTVRDALHKLKEKAGAKKPLAKEVNEAFDTLLEACDVAESNHHLHWAYIAEVTGSAKESVVAVGRSLASLEQRWDDEEYAHLNAAVEQIFERRKDLAADSHKLAAANMSAYQDNSWVKGLEDALSLVTEKAHKTGEMHKRVESHNQGMAQAHEAEARMKRMDEYWSRAEAMQKTARALYAKHLSILPVAGKALGEAEELAQLAEKEATDFEGRLEAALRQSHAVAAAVVETKEAQEDFAELFKVEQKLGHLLSECKAKLKTLRIQHDELKKQYPWGATQKAFEKPYGRIGAAIHRLDTALAEYTKGLAPIHKMIEQGKKLQ